MDPRKKGQVSGKVVGSAASVPQYQIMPQQISNIPSAQFQSSPIPPQVAAPSSNANKIAIGAIGVLIAIVALVFLLGRQDTESPNVAPSNQQSGSSSSQTSDEAVEEYAEQYPSYDDYPYEFRNAFIDSCAEETTYESCICSLEQMEELYTLDEVEIVFNSGEDFTWLSEMISIGCY